MSCFSTLIMLILSTNHLGEEMTKEFDTILTNE